VILRSKTRTHEIERKRTKRTKSARNERKRTKRTKSARKANQICTKFGS
jgi:hypothetical protein